MIHVNRGATSLGVFSEEEVREGLRTGRFAPSDIGWREGMATWQPLSQFPELVTAAPAAPPPQAAPLEVSESVATRTGLPWDHRHERGFFNAFVETLILVLTKPSEAFTAMRREGGLGAMFGMGAGSAVFLILLPLFVVLALFIGSAVVHVCLMIVGGANQPFETTFRVLAFSHGSTGPLQMIPVCGGMIAGVWALVCNCIGLARAHETDTGRAVLAVFLPVIVCCGGGLLVAFMFGALGAWSASHH